MGDKAADVEKDYVRANLAESISSENLAELAELSPFHFSRVLSRPQECRLYNS